MATPTVPTPPNYQSSDRLGDIIRQELSLKELRDPDNCTHYNHLSLEQYMNTKYDDKRNVLKMPLVYISCLDNVVAQYCIHEMNNSPTKMSTNQLNRYEKVSSQLINRHKTRLWKEIMHKRPLSFALVINIFEEALHVVYNHSIMPYLMSTVKCNRNMRSINCWTSHDELHPLYSSYQN